MKRILTFTFSVFLLVGCASVRNEVIVAQEGVVDVRNYRLVQEISDSKDISRYEDCSLIDFIDLVPGNFNEIVGIRVEKRIEYMDFFVFDWVTKVRCDFRALGLQFKY